MGLTVLAPAGEAAHQPPAFLAPEHGAFAQGPTVTVQGTAAGDVELVRIFEGAAILGDTGPVGGFWSIDLPLADGAHTLRARGRDGGGVWSALSDPWPFTVDSVAPAAPAIVVPADGAVLSFSSVTVQGNAEPGSIVHVGISTGGTGEATTDLGGNWAFTKDFADAPHTLVARATDRAGNVSLPSDPVTFTVDTLAPAAPILDTPGDGAVVRPGTVTITGRAEPGSTVRISEGAVIQTTTSSSAGTWRVSHLFTEGTHTLSARATDAAGHVSPVSASMTFRVDVTAPDIPTILSPAEGAVVPHRYEVSGTAEPNATVQLLFNAAVLAQTTATPTGAWSVELSSFSGPKKVQARVKDAAGNLSGLSPVRSFIVDADHPRVRITTPSNTIFLPTQTPVIDGTASDNLGVLAIELHFFDVFGKDVLTKNATCVTCPLDAEVEWFLKHGMPPGAYVVKAWAVDRAGNRSLPAEITIVDL